MSFIGKLHEISLYGLLATIVSLTTEKVSLVLLWAATWFNFNAFLVFKRCIYKRIGWMENS